MKGIRIYIILTIIVFSKAAFSKAVYYSFAKQCKLATEIYIGHVISVVDSTYQFKEPWEGLTHSSISIVKVKFVHTWKGQVKDTMTFRFDNTIACFGNRFKSNEDFIIFVTNNEVDFGSGRTNLIKDNKDLRRLNFKYRRYRYKSK